MADNGVIWNALASVPLLGQLMHLADEKPSNGTYRGEVHAAIKERYFKSNRTGMLVHHRAWPVSDGAAKGVVYILHGVAEYVGRYEGVARLLNTAGFAVVGLDHCGHGLSEGSPRGYFTRLDDLVADALQLIHEVHSTPPGTPRFLLGHSMGALVSLQVAHASGRLEGEAASALSGGPACAQYHVSGWTAGARSSPGHGGWAGLVLSGPCLVFDPAIDNPFNRLLARTFSSLLPKMEVQALDSDQIAADKSVVAQYLRDPMIAHGPLRVRCGFEIMTGVEAVRSFAPSLTLPLLIVHGQEDKLCSIEGSAWLLSAVGSADKTLTPYPGLRHEIFNEQSGPDVVQHVCAWLAAHA